MYNNPLGGRSGVAGSDFTNAAQQQGTLGRVALSADVEAESRLPLRFNSSEEYHQHLGLGEADVSGLSADERGVLFAMMLFENLASGSEGASRSGTPSSSRPGTPSSYRSAISDSDSEDGSYRSAISDSDSEYGSYRSAISDSDSEYGSYRSAISDSDSEYELSEDEEFALFAMDMYAAATNALERGESTRSSASRSK